METRNIQETLLTDFETRSGVVWEFLHGLWKPADGSREHDSMILRKVRPGRQSFDLMMPHHVLPSMQDALDRYYAHIERRHGRQGAPGLLQLAPDERARFEAAAAARGRGR